MKSTVEQWIRSSSGALLGVATAKIAGIVVAILLLAALMSWAERKQSALIQNRVGPHRARLGPFRLGGLVHVIADGLKILLKEDFTPLGASRGLFMLAPLLAFVPALLAFAVVPFGDVWCAGGEVWVRHFHDVCVGGQISDPFRISAIDAGVLFIFANLSLGIYGAVLAGWSSNNKFGLIGATRATAQTLSCQLTTGLTLVSVLLVYETVDLNEMVRDQGELLFGWLPKWGVVVQPLAFLLFFTAAVVTVRGPPFDIPESESELMGGCSVEHSSQHFALFTLSERVGAILVAALVATIFLGGWQVPWLYGDGVRSSMTGAPWLPLPYVAVKLIQLSAFATKVVLLCGLQIMLRWTLPRFRPDQLMRLGWKILLPLSLTNLVVTAGFLLWWDR